MRVLGGALAVSAALVLAGCGAGDAPQANGEASALSTDAAWTLDSDASRIAFVSIKDGEVIETHYFPELVGRVSPGGESLVEIPLDRVQTKIDIRDERMREMFFDTSRFPVATIRASVATDALSALAIGERVRQPLTGMLSLHGQEARIDVDAFVTRIADDRVEVQSAEPVIVYLADFDLEPGLERLREVAFLSSITASSPVTFTFVFEAGGEGTNASAEDA